MYGRGLLLPEGPIPQATTGGCDCISSEPWTGELVHFTDSLEFVEMRPPWEGSIVEVPPEGPLED